MTLRVLGAVFTWPLRLLLGRHASVWRALVVLPLLPALGVPALAVELTRDRLQQVAAAQRVERDVVAVRTLEQLRTALGEELEVAAVWVLEGDDYRSYLDRARPFLGVALGSVEQSRSTTDQLVVQLPELALPTGTLAELAADLAIIRRFVGSPDGSLEQRLKLLNSVIERYVYLADKIFEAESYQVHQLASGAQGLTGRQLLAQTRALESIVMVVAPGEMAVRSLYLRMMFPSHFSDALLVRAHTAAMRYRIRSQDLSGQLPASLARTWKALVDDPEILGFSSLLDVALQPGVTQPTTTGDQVDPTQTPQVLRMAHGGARFLTGLGAFLDQAVQEAVATAQDDRHRANLRAVESVALAGVLLIVTIVTVVMTGGALRGRLRELAAGAQRLSAGHLDHVPVRGPRELAAASGAINDAVLNLRHVQVKAEILASGDLSAPELEEPAPGPLGGAVHASVARIVSTAREREDLRLRLAYEATHDALTGLVNRAEVHVALRSALARVRLSHSSVSVVFIDLDRFKACNDRFGHAAGDHVLRVVSASLTGQIREQDTAGRLGGDEFVLIIESLPIGPELVRFGSRLVQALSTPITYENHVIEIGASIGIASDTGGSVDADELIRQADTAAYRAKAAGGGTVEVCGSTLIGHVESR